MAPVAFGVLAMIAGVVVVAVFIGAISGPILWKLNFRLIPSAVSVVVLYLLLIVLLDRPAMGFAAYFGVLPALLTFFIGNLTARFLARRKRLRSVWIGLIALGTASIFGVLYLWMFRIFLGLSRG
jgi:uncharacterized PurR-regulated membrane protein YhhQ (DUF165 family)